MDYNGLIGCCSRVDKDVKGLSDIAKTKVLFDSNYINYFFFF